jgi:DNA-binding transcriptional ArsR family regulator
MTPEGGNLSWEAVARQLLHPTKVRILTALTDVPGSATGLFEEFVIDDPEITLEDVSYHVTSLLERDVLVSAEGQHSTDGDRKFVALGPEILR